MFVLSTKFMLTTVMLGAIYSLMGYGLTLSFGAARFINFSFGELLTTSAFILAFVLVPLGSIFTSPYVALPITVLLVGIVGMIIAEIFFKPIRERGHFPLLVTSIGVGFLIRNLWLMGQALKGKAGTAIGFPFPLPSLGVQAGVFVALTVIVFLLYYYMLYKTTFGAKIRAICANRDLSEAMGINIHSCLRRVWFIASLMAGIGGISLLTVHAFRVATGFGFLLTAFTVTLMGGIGRPEGCFTSGFIVAFAIQLATRFFYSVYTWVYVFIIMIATLSLKPEGIFRGYVHP